MIEKLVDYNQIIKDCFWDYNIEKKDIEEIIHSSNFRLKQKLFSKIIYNSTDKARTLQSLFDKETLVRLFATFVATYNKKYIDKYLLVLKNILLNENNYIESLAWKKR